jgi:hypothetical protein
MPELYLVHNKPSLSIIQEETEQWEEEGVKTQGPPAHISWNSKFIIQQEVNFGGEIHQFQALLL